MLSHNLNSCSLTILNAMPRISRRLVCFLAVLGVLLASCGSDDDGSDSATAAPVSGDVTVFAAASLTDAFTEIGDAFMAEYPDVEVRFNFAASSELVTQINEGASVDVFCFALRQATW